MAVKIRLMRVGKKKQPTYRVVVADARSPRDGRIIETIGHYGPRNEPSLVEINGDRALAWLRQGAQPTEQVQKLLTVAGIWSTFEAERGGKVVTQLSRRVYATAAAKGGPAAKPAAKAASAPAPTPEPAPAAEAPPAPAEAEPAAAEDAVETVAGEPEAAESDAGEQSEETSE